MKDIHRHGCLCYQKRQGASTGRGVPLVKKSIELVRSLRD